jgi:hypothetical protein
VVVDTKLAHLGLVEKPMIKEVIMMSKNLAWEAQKKIAVLDDAVARQL